MKQEKKPTVGKNFDLENEMLVEEFKEQEEKSRLESEMEVEWLAEKQDEEDGLYLDSSDDSESLHVLLNEEDGLYLDSSDDSESLYVLDEENAANFDDLIGNTKESNS